MDEAPDIVKKAVEMAKAGSPTALRLVFTRLLAPRRDDPIEIDLVPITSPIDAVVALAQLAQAIAAGEITPRQGQEIASIIIPLVKGLPNEWEIQVTDVTEEE